MKKILLGVSMVILAGCSNANQSSTTGQQTADQAAGEYQEMAQAIESGKSVRCEMTDTTTGNKMTYFMKGQKIRMQNMKMTEEDMTGSMLMADNYMYTWSDLKKEGTKFTIPEETESDTNTDTTQNVPDMTSEADRQAYEEQGYTIDCNVEDVPDAIFTPPVDVKFTDMSAMLEQLNQKKMENQAQQGMTPEQQAEFNKMMEQYAQ